MPRFSKKEKEEWIEKSKQMEQECKEMVKKIAENYVRDPDMIAELLDFGSRFYEYSLRNNQLIYAQNKYALYVQSFPAWKKMGYSVKRGETGLKIWVPVSTTLLKINDEFIKLSDATQQQKADYRSGKIEGITSTRFKLGSVFDISQTNFPPEKYPEVLSVGYPSEMHEDIFKGLMDYSKKYVHCDVRIEDISSITIRGYYNRREKEIVLNSKLRGTQKLSTMAHELGHAIRHNMIEGLSMHRKEFEADAISIMIESGFGLELTDARKAHLSSHYKSFRCELEEELGDDYSEEMLNSSINDVLASVYGTYSGCIEDINACVEKYVPHERLLAYEQNKALEQAKENHVNKENEIETDIYIGLEKDNLTREYGMENIDREL